MSILNDLTGIAHIVIPTTNLQKTIKFYLDLGFETILKTFNIEANEQVAFLQFKDIIIQTNETLNAKEKIQAIDHMSINISDIEKAFKEAKTRGYDLLDDEVQYRHFCKNEVKFFTLIGPSNEKIEFYQKL
ncbi:VOC family protein [Clostridium uliginosum]|uniref:Glyoxalase/Bleomycin resistance protein/Dioxygenase superfamily protein n=1 Tax=Clostridium uliginosum TaxID=119641 RepID=A0A1I1NK74_9CLOT|nr:VOC family protein [Clostridium uliginosum]SFC97826.1 Glyoxalase/Bleomycin resistance protein/Dioxygenase superfamily protein [Clostridium uliginosum]